MVTLLFVERMYMSGVLFVVKLLGRTPKTMWKWQPMREDVEQGNSSFPMVLVQIPMYNEKEVTRSCYNATFIILLHCS
jgi:beta-mannan synthase